MQSMQKKTSRIKSTPKARHLVHASANTVDTGRKSRRERVHRPFTTEELKRISGEISLRELPALTVSHLELMAIDPWNIHAYWHIQPSELAKCRARFAGNGVHAKLVLRFSDVSPRQGQNSVHEQFDIEVADDSNSWYVNLWRDGKHYTAEIGLKTEDGLFEALAKSNEVVTPRAYPSADLDFYLVDAHTPNMPESASAIIPRVINDDLLSNLFPQRLSPSEFPLIDQNTFAPVLDEPVFPDLVEPESENVGDIRDFPLLDQQELEQYGSLTRKSIKKILARSRLPALDEPPAGMVAPSDITFDSQPFSISMLEQSAEALQPHTAESPDSVANRPLELRITENKRDKPVTSTVALETYVGKFDLSSSSVDHVLTAEVSLIFEGVCPPEACLLLFGEQVPIAPDGSFRIKLPVERGPELLEFMYRACNRQKE